MGPRSSLASSFMLALLLVAAKAVAQPSLISSGAQQRAQTLLKQMTIEEKVGQLTLSSGLINAERPDSRIAQGQVGGILWLIDVKEMNRLQHIAVDQSRLHIPLLFGDDVIHGYKTVFPVPLAMASSWDPAVEEQAQRFASEDARAAGIRWTFAPMVDIARDSRWGRIVEGAGEDPYLGSAMARAQVRGFQGKSLGPDSVLACAKHFAGYGAVVGGRDYDAAYVPEVLLRNVYLPPFLAAEQQGIGSFMSAYIDLNDIPAAGNSWLLTDILRKEWGFTGFVVADDHAVANMVTQGYAADPADAAVKAIDAGLNMDMASETFSKHLPVLVAEGKVTEAQLDRAVLPVLALKYQLGLFDHPFINESKVDATLSRPEGLVLERKLAVRSMVLLKNENKTLPLSKSLKKVAVIGRLADSPLDIEGCCTLAEFSPNGFNTHPVTVLAGLKYKLGTDAQITYVAGPALPVVDSTSFGTSRREIPSPAPTSAEISVSLERVKVAAESADVVIAVMGELANMSSEHESRATLDLPGIQQQMLEAAVSTGKPVVLVLENGRPLDIRWAAMHTQAILEAWYPGTEGGNAVADLLFGDVDPGGKLPVSWPQASGQEPLYYDHNLTQFPEDRPNSRSRYWDMSSKPLYPFGYGLSYTTFKFTNLKISEPSIKVDGATEVSVDVTNSGTVAGDAVAQVYIHQRSGSASRPVRQLKGFQRVTLQPGESKTLKFRLGKEELQFWSPLARTWVTEPPGFDVWAGEDSTAALHAVFTVTK